jgi:Sulfotransferase family
MAEQDPDVPPRAPVGRPKVVYVMGAGRSGSTILGVALGNCDNVFFAGELDRWLPRSGIPRDDPEVTRFWSTVREDVDDAAELFGGKTTYLERSSALLDIRKWRTRRRLRRRYRDVSESLYLAIGRAAGTTHIVDTSHYPLRARELRALRGIDLYLLFLVRDPQGVVASLGRHDVVERRFGMPTANAYLWLTYLLSVFVFLRHPRERRLFVRHEDLVADPEGVLRQILDRCDSTASPPDLRALRTGVPFHGNRLIGSKVVALSPSTATPDRVSRVTAVLQLPWAAVFSRLRPAVSASRSHGA